MSAAYYVCGQCGRRVPFWYLYEHRCAADQDEDQ